MLSRMMVCVALRVGLGEALTGNDKEPSPNRAGYYDL